MGEISLTSANLLGVPVDQTHSLQATIELVYVQSANDVLYNHLGALQTALQTTANSLNALTQLQNLHNTITVKNKGTFLASTTFDHNSVAFVISYIPGYDASAPNGVNWFPVNYNYTSSQTFANSLVGGNNGYALQPSQVVNGGGSYGGQAITGAAYSYLNPINGVTYYAIVSTHNFAVFSSANTLVYADLTGAAFNKAASAFFGTPVGVSVNYGTGGISAFYDKMVSLVKTVSALIHNASYGLSALSPSGSLLLTTMQQVLADLKANGIDQYPSLASAQASSQAYYATRAAAYSAQADYIAADAANTTAYNNLTLANNVLALNSPPKDAAEANFLFWQNVYNTNPTQANYDAYQAALNNYVAALAVWQPYKDAADAAAATQTQTQNTLAQKLVTLQTTSNAWDAVRSQPAYAIYSNYSTFNDYLTSVAGRFNNWVIDGNNSSTGPGASTAGKIQTNLTKAITAATAQNSTQTERVRAFLFLFEEYYKSASAMLAQITQLITKMAQGINR